MTSIEWTQRPGTRGETLNPIRARNRATGKAGWFCVHVNGDCTHCYAETLNLKGGESGGNGIAYRAQLQGRVEIFLDEERLVKPLSWRKPRTIFLCSMTDLFAAFVTDAWLDKVFAVAALCPQHTFIMLTKRPKRMRLYCSGPMAGQIWNVADRIACAFDLDSSHPANSYLAAGARAATWPLPNVWLGTSCGTQQAADEFIPELLATPAAVRFVSVEPMRGPVDLITVRRFSERAVAREFFDVLRGEVWTAGVGGTNGHSALSPKTGIDWVICGGESGPKARPMHPDWARALRDQCAAAGVPFFFKQWGEWCSEDQEQIAEYRGCEARTARETILDNPVMHRVGHAIAGRELDGRVWNEFPRPA